MAKSTRSYRSDALQASHSAMQGLHKVGAIDKMTMRQFDATCLTPVDDLRPERIKNIREAAQMSQAIFALILNVTTSLVSQWERGEKKPSGPSLKLLALADSKEIDSIL